MDCKKETTNVILKLGRDLLRMVTEGHGQRGEETGWFLFFFLKTEFSCTLTASFIGQKTVGDFFFFDCSFKLKS